MATMPKPFLTAGTYPLHDYHAEANVLTGHLLNPVDQEIQKQASVHLRNEHGGHFFQRVEHYSLEGLISFRSGYTHASGYRSLKNQGWVTLSTSVLEGLNVLDVITADRMVAQISTEHPLENGHVPHVTFLGTRFENLRIGGYEVKMDFDLNICGDKPKNDRPYLEDSGFLKRVEQQCASIARASGVPKAVQGEYNGELNQIALIRKDSNGSGKQNGKELELECSLVKSIDPIPVAKAFGNVLEIPGFGVVKLAQVEIGYRPEKNRAKDNTSTGSHYFHLTMLQMHMGCIGDGKVSAASVTANGKTRP